MQRLTKLSLRRNVEYNVQLLSINVHVINHFIVISTNSNCNFVKYIKKINAAEICPVVELAARTAGPAVPDPNAPITSTANA